MSEVVMNAVWPCDSVNLFDFWCCRGGASAWHPQVLTDRRHASEGICAGGEYRCEEALGEQLVVECEIASICVVNGTAGASEVRGTLIESPGGGEQVEVICV